MSIREQEVTTIELSQHEIQFLLEILANAEKVLIVEISHTDTRDYRDKLEKKLTLLEAVRARLQALGV